MYYYASTTATNRHRVVSADSNWAPGDISYTMAADAFNNSTRRDVTVHAPTENSASAEQSQSSFDHTSRSRRSHRPRGCRGGRKNRKVKSSNHDPPLTNSPPYRRYDSSCTDNPSNQQYSNSTYQYTNEPSIPSFPIADNSVIAKGDLSPYQHVKINQKPWNAGLQGLTNRVGTSSSQPTSTNQQMLPPPVPSALFHSHQQNMESINLNIFGSGLKMLPSFEDDELDNGCGGNVRRDYNHQYYDSHDDSDDSSESLEYGMSIPRPSEGLGDAHHTPLRCGRSCHKSGNRGNNLNPSMYHPNDNPSEATVDTCGTVSSRSRTSSSSSDDSAMAMTSETNLMTTNNVNIPVEQQQQQSTLLKKSQPSSKTFVLPILHLHITPPLLSTIHPPQSTLHNSTAHSSSASSSSSSCSSGFGSLFVTSPRSFLFGIGRGARHTPITEQRRRHQS